MTTIKQVAEAFASGNKAKCHNAETDGQSYWLHGNKIAFKSPMTGDVMADWCGYYTVTTANHLNHIVDAIKSPFKVSRAFHKLHSVGSFNLSKRVI